MNDLERRFLHHPPTSPGVAQTHEVLRMTFLRVAQVVQALPESRERSTALTKLEEGLFWANAAVARQQVSIVHEPPATPAPAGGPVAAAAEPA